MMLMVTNAVQQRRAHTILDGLTSTSAPAAKLNTMRCVFIEPISPASEMDDAAAMPQQYHSSCCYTACQFFELSVELRNSGLSTKVPPKNPACTGLPRLNSHFAQTRVFQAIRYHRSMLRVSSILMRIFGQSCRYESSFNRSLISYLPTLIELAVLQELVCQADILLTPK